MNLWLTIGTGVALAAVESGLRPLWLHQGRGRHDPCEIGPAMCGTVCLGFPVANLCSP